MSAEIAAQIPVQISAQAPVDQARSLLTTQVRRRRTFAIITHPHHSL